jgi:hypothetical protein
MTNEINGGLTIIPFKLKTQAKGLLHGPGPHSPRLHVIDFESWVLCRKDFAQFRRRSLGSTVSGPTQGCGQMSRTRADMYDRTIRGGDLDEILKEDEVSF